MIWCRYLSTKKTINPWINLMLILNNTCLLIVIIFVMGSFYLYIGFFFFCHNKQAYRAHSSIYDTIFFSELNSLCIVIINECTGYTSFDSVNQQVYSCKVLLRIIYKYWLHERVTWDIVTTRKPTLTKAKLRLTWVFKGWQFPMLPSGAVNNYYIILNVSVIKYVHPLH